MSDMDKFRTSRTIEQLISAWYFMRRANDMINDTVEITEDDLRYELQTAWDDMSKEVTKLKVTLQRLEVLP
jgi:hypothetical protein